MKQFSRLILFSFLFCTSITQTISRKEKNECTLAQIIALGDHLLAENKERDDAEWKKWEKEQEKKSRKK